MVQRWSPEKSTLVSIYSAASLAQGGVCRGGGGGGMGGGRDSWDLRNYFKLMQTQLN